MDAGPIDRDFTLFFCSELRGLARMTYLRVIDPHGDVQCANFFNFFRLDLL